MIYITRNTHVHHASCQMYTMYIILLAIIHVCLSGLWLGGLLHLSFLSDFLKLVYFHVLEKQKYNIMAKHSMNM